MPSNFSYAKKNTSASVPFHISSDDLRKSRSNVLINNASSTFLLIIIYILSLFSFCVKYFKKFVFTFLLQIRSFLCDILPKTRISHANIYSLFFAVLVYTCNLQCYYKPQKMLKNTEICVRIKERRKNGCKKGMTENDENRTVATMCKVKSCTSNEHRQKPKMCSEGGGYL